PAADISKATSVPDVVGMPKGHCAVVPPTMPPSTAKLGEACRTTCRASTDDGCVDVAGAMRTAICLVADGLVCDAMTRLCVAVPQIREACSGVCATGAYCDTTGQCQAKTADGSCVGAPDACADTSYCACGEATCDPTKLHCVTRGPVKAQCVSNTQCMSSYCYQGFCRVKTPVSAALCEGDY